MTMTRAARPEPGQWRDFRELAALQDFDRHLPVQHGVVGKPDFAHAAHAKGLNELVLADDPRQAVQGARCL